VSGLIRDPAEWAREFGWISRRRAENMARDLFSLAGQIEGADPPQPGWAKELRRIAKKLAPTRGRDAR
jgi:hypothetical protein